MPSKSLLHSAAIHHDGGDYGWPKAAARRDYMINRVDRPYPDDSGHVHDLEGAGARVIRGTARILGPGRVEVATSDGTVTLAARNLRARPGFARPPTRRGRHRRDPAVDEP